MNLCIICFKTTNKDIINKLVSGLNLTNSVEITDYNVGNDLFDLIEMDRLIILQHDSWIISFIKPSFCIDGSLTPTLSKLSEQANILMVLVQSITGGLWLEYHEYGELIRQWVEIEGEVVHDIGNPLTAEISFLAQESYNRDYWGLFRLLKDITGFDLSSLS